MSIERASGFEDLSTMTCDDCGETEDFEESDWAAVNRLAKEAGWGKTKAGTKWMDLCPGCREDYQESGR